MKMTDLTEDERILHALLNTGDASTGIPHNTESSFDISENNVWRHLREHQTLLFQDSRPALERLVLVESDSWSKSNVSAREMISDRFSS
jgi:hypothetical protein